MVCPQCGERITAADHRYCPACGALLGRHPAPVTRYDPSAERIVVADAARPLPAWRPQSVPPLLLWGGAVIGALVALAAVIVVVMALFEALAFVAPIIIFMGLLWLMAQPRRRRRRWARRWVRY